MIEAAEQAMAFVSGRPRSDTDTMLRLAVVRAIEIVGEAESRVSAATRLAMPEVRWREIVAMRNRLAHGYFEIDQDILWRTVTAELPALLTILRRESITVEIASN